MVGSAADLNKFTQLHKTIKILCFFFLEMLAMPTVRSAYAENEASECYFLEYMSCW